MRTYYYIQTDEEFNFNFSLEKRASNTRRDVERSF